MNRLTRSGLYDASLALVVSAFLAMVYLLTFSGQFRSIDEFALYARTESLAQGNGLETPQLAFSSLHHPVGALEPGQSVLAVPLYLLVRNTQGISNIAAVMLFNVFITALSGTVLFLLLRRLSFSPAVSALTVLAWGIGTTAWPYARSFFREPLLGLVWASATLLCVMWHQTHKPVHIGACLAVLGAGLAVKISSVPAIPVFLIALLWDPDRHRFAISWRRVLLLGMAGIVTLGAGSILYRMRYGTALPIAQYTWQYPFRDALLAAYGLFLSPVKGLVFFSPIIIATLAGWPRFIKQHGAAAFVALGVSLSLLYAYGRAPQWHGGHVVWGPRFVVPLLPLLLMPYATALADRRVWVRGWVGIWSAIGLVVQFAAGTASWSDAIWQMVPAYVDEALVGLDGIPWYSWSLINRSPALVQLTGWHPRQLDITWLRTLSDGSLAYDAPLGALLLAAAGLVLIALGLLLAHKRLVLRYQLSVAGVCLLLIGFATGSVLLRSGRNTNDHWGLTRTDAQQLASAISQHDAPYTVVLVSNDFFVYFWLGLLKGDFTTQWYSPHDVAGLSAAVQPESDADTIWLVIDHAHMPGDADPYMARHLLAQQAYEISGQWVDAYEVLAYAPPVPLRQEIVNHHWQTGIQIDSISINTYRLFPGDTLRLDLSFSATEPLSQDYVLYTHLVPQMGLSITSRDGPPQYGGAPTTVWQPGQTVWDRRGIAIPEEALPGVYQIVAGWLAPDGIPMMVATDSEALASGQVVLGTVEIAEH